jgi:hypothetical protein
MHEVDLPTVAPDTLLEDAAEQLRQSDRSGLVVLQTDGAHLYRASDIELQLPNRAKIPIKDVAGAVWVPAESIIADMNKVNAVFLRTERGRAVVRFMSDVAYFRNSAATTRYYCNLDPANHNYSPSQVALLTKATGGVGWNCEYSDGGIVT